MLSSNENDVSWKSSQSNDKTVTVNVLIAAAQTRPIVSCHSNTLAGTRLLTIALAKVSILRCKVLWQHFCQTLSKSVYDRIRYSANKKAAIFLKHNVCDVDAMCLKVYFIHYLLLWMVANCQHCYIGWTGGCVVRCAGRSWRCCSQTPSTQSAWRRWISSVQVFLLLRLYTLSHSVPVRLLSIHRSLFVSCFLSHSVLLIYDLTIVCSCSSLYIGRTSNRPTGHITCLARPSVRPSVF